MTVRGKEAAWIAILIVHLLFEPSSSQRSHGLTQRVSQLEANQVIMEERLENQEEITQELREELNSIIQEANNENHTSEHTAAPTNAPPTVSPSLLTEFVVTPLEVKRQKLATGYRFTVRYVPHAQNLRIVYINNTLTMSYDNDVVPNYIELQGTPDQVGGVQKITFERDFQAITPSGVNPHYVYFMTETERVGIKINIYPSHHDTLVTPVHLTEFTLTPAEQVVYQPGRNTEMLWANYSGWSYFNVKATVVDTSSGQAAVIKLVHHSRFFNTSYSNQYSTDVDKSIGGNILTASLTFSGYLDVTVGNFSLSNSSAVETLDVTKRLLLRPNTQTGPFPDGYLGFPRSQNRRELADGTPLLYCNSTEGSQCTYQVNVLSVGPVQLTCEETINSETRIPLPVTQASQLGFDQHMKSYMFSVQARSARQNSSTVQCTAVSDAGRSQIQSIRVMYFVGPVILLSESSAVMQNGNLTVTCTATGHPLPSLTVDVVSSGHSYRYYNIPAEQTTVSSNGAKITGTLTVMRNPNTTVERVSCTSSIIVNRNGEVDYISSFSRQVFS